MIAANIADLRLQARARLPRLMFDYLDGGSFEGQTLAENRRALDRIGLRQRVLRDVGKKSAAVTLFGERLPAPIALAPVGMSGLFYRDGEIAAARAAAKAKVPYILSTLSIASIEEVARATDAPFWFQLYVWRDRVATADLIRRAEAAGCPALVVTVDLQALAPRHADLRNGLAVPPRASLRNAFDLLRHPAWCIDLLRGGMPTFGNIAGYGSSGGGTNALMRWSSGQFDPALDWSTIAWIRDIWKGRLVLKGILDPEDAVTAFDMGADAVIVSNHGGRQLDGTIAAIDALPLIRERVGPERTLLMDSGLRTGQDVFRALALGANACLIGRAYAYGLAAAGEAGVARAIRMILRELDISMALCGVQNVADLSRVNLLDLSSDT